MYIYVIRCEQFRKIGQAKDPQWRFAGMIPGNPFPMELERTIPCDPVLVDLAERAAHRWLADRWERGEWFRVELAEAVDAIERGMRWAQSPTEDLFPEVRAGDPDADAIIAKLRAAAHVTQRKYEHRTVRAREARVLKQREDQSAAIEQVKPAWNDPDKTIIDVQRETGESRSNLHRWQKMGLLPPKPRARQ